MAYTPIPFGTPLWHTPVNNAFTSQDARITTAEEQLAATPAIGETVPADHNAIAWTGDPGHSMGTTVPTTGVLHMVRLMIREEVTLTSVAYLVTTAGSGLTAGQNFIGLYDSTGALLRSTADQTVNFGGAAFRQANWSTPVLVPVGAYWVAFLVNGTTAPTLGRYLSWTPAPEILNVGLTVTTARSATSGAGLTALPTPVTMSARTLSGTNWVAVLL